MRLLISRSAGETQRMAGRLARRFGTRRPLILALAGELGSGKTAFVQGLARALGLRGRIQSPTFVLAKWYQLPARTHRLYGFRHFVHVDAYRLTAREARALGLAAAFRDRDAVVIIEWADRIRKLIPRGAVWVWFAHGKKARERRLQISKF